MENSQISRFSLALTDAPGWDRFPRRILYKIDDEDREMMMKTVAAVSFRNNQSISMDIEGVKGISLGAPMQLDDGTWFCEMLVRAENGVVALQLLAESPDKFAVQNNSEI